jgi:lipopolysaccharide O-acetyltransferase
MLSCSFLRACDLWQRLKSRVFALMSGGAFYRFGANSVIQPPARLLGESSISVGEGVFIGANSWLQVLKPSSSAATLVIDIQDGVSFAGFCTISAALSVVIESDVLVARNVYISDHIHSFADRTNPIQKQGISHIAPVRICRGAWLGQGVVVCPGVTIGRGAVIGANSVVRHDVPDFSVAAGVPARVIRMVDEAK